ncbi:BF3164 family lipoprotein [Maribacter algicola]|uniref:BF3164 family lipoprotein n=1 Tax=Meishania litoralis TaxID=3434685 RepID=A0ACC7LK19_9FLAO
MNLSVSFAPKIAIFGILAALIFSCQSESSYFQENATTVFIDDDFTKIVHLKSEELDYFSDSLIFGPALSIVNEYLFISEVKTNKFVHILRIPDDVYLGKFGRKGVGQGEILIPWEFSKSKDGLIRILDKQQNKLVEYYADSLAYRGQFNKEYFLDPMAMVTSASIYNNKLYFLNRSDSEFRLYEKGLSDGYEKGYGELPEKAYFFMSNKKHREICSANLTNRENIFVVSYRYIPMIQIFDLDKSRWVSIVGPENSVPRYKNQTSSTYYHPSIKISDDYIYALYNGKKKKGIYSQQGNTIYMFSHDGVPIKKIVLDKNIVSFDIYDSKFIYAYSFNENLEPKILKFALNL